jgi:hypothetical protein
MDPERSPGEDAERVHPTPAPTRQSNYEPRQPSTG